MPAKDGTGPVGFGGCGTRYGCSEKRGCGRGAGLRLRDGTGCCRVPLSPEERKNFLMARRKIFESRIKDIDTLLNEN